MAELVVGACHCRCGPGHGLALYVAVRALETTSHSITFEASTEQQKTQACSGIRTQAALHGKLQLQDTQDASALARDC